MIYNFLAIGEAMIELAPLAQTDEYKLAFAGDSFNTSWYLKRSNPAMNVNFASRIGVDETSEKFLSYLRAYGFGTDYISRSETRTMGLYLISLKDGERSFSYWRGQSAAREMLKGRALIEDACSASDMIYFSGITLAILDETSRQQLLEILAKARAGGAQIAFDSNLRPKLWASGTEMCEWVAKASEVCDVILPSFDDEAKYFGDADPKGTMERYLAAGAQTVVVKNGGGEILYTHRGEVGKFVPQKVANIVDTTAAGDSFNGGFFAHFDTSGDIQASIKEACELASKVIGQRGGLVEVWGE